MASIHALINIFAATPTLANAKKLVSKTIHNPMSVCLILADGAAQIEKAKALVANAKNPAKTKEAMQRELRARYPNILEDEKVPVEILIWERAP